MEIRKPHIKSIPYSEFKDNDTLEKITGQLNDGGANVILGNLDQVINWGRSNSLWSLTFGTSCCGIEFMAVGCARYDFSRFGFEVTRNSARQADLIMCAGTITNKMAPVFKRLYDEMAEPKYVVAVGGNLSVAEVVVGLLARRKLPCLHRREEGLDGFAGLVEGLLQGHGTVGLVAGRHADDGVLALFGQEPVHHAGGVVWGGGGPYPAPRPCWR